MPTATPQDRFVPWALPAFALLAGGITLGATVLPWWVPATALLPAFAFVHSRWRAAWPGWLPLPILLCLPLGALRYHVWERAPDPVAPLLGQTVTVSGRSDGRILTLDEPAGGRLALSPATAVPAGRTTVRGRVQEAAGKRNPGGFDYRGYLRRRGVGGVLRVDEVLTLTPAAGVRARLLRAVQRGLSRPQAALLAAMTLGVRDDLGELRDSFSASGLAHVLALSGLHVGVLLVALERLLRPLGLRRYPLMIALTAGFVLLVGPSPSVLRASLMAMAALLSLWLGVGRLEPWPTLALAGLLSLLYNPSWLFDLSFQLSYLAVLGILLIAPPLLKLLQADGAWWRPRVLLLGGMTVSVAAQLPSLPLVAGAFGSVPLFSPLVNVVAVPLATVLVPLGFLTALAGAVWLPLAGLLNQLTALPAALLIFLAEAAARLPAVPWGEVGALGYGRYLLALAAVVLVLHRYLRPWRGLLIILAVLLASLTAAERHPPPELIFFDVGQGDSVLLRLPGRQEVLIDGGGTPFSDFDVGARTVVPALRALDVDELELVVASHADADHIEGLISVLELMPVGMLLIGVPAPDKRLFVALLQTAARRGVPVRQLQRGEAIVLGRARLDVLHPPARPSGDSNADSVVLLIRWDEAPWALLAGDAPAEVEAELAVPPVPLLMAPHHGSASSTSAALLAAAQPREVIISVGENDFGHPRAEVLGRIAAAGARLHLTRERGALRFSLGR